MGEPKFPKWAFLFLVLMLVPAKFTEGYTWWTVGSFVGMGVFMAILLSAKEAARRKHARKRGRTFVVINKINKSVILCCKSKEDDGSREYHLHAAGASHTWTAKLSSDLPFCAILLTQRYKMAKNETLNLCWPRCWVYLKGRCLVPV